MNIMNVPRLNANDETIRLTEWAVIENTYVNVGDCLARVETSKTSLDIQSEYAGYIEFHCAVNDIIKIGDLFITFHHEPLDVKNINIENTHAVNEHGPVFSFAAKKYISDNHLDISQYKGNGLLTIDDIKEKKGLSEAVSSIKQSEIKRLSEAQSGVLNSVLTIGFDSEPIRMKLKEIPWINSQILPYILFILAKTLTGYPKFTSYYENEKIHFYQQVNLGVAIDLGKGLKVVVIKDADKLSLYNIHMSLIDLISNYYENSLSIDEVLDSTITISDLSSDGILYFQPLINKNQSVVIGIGGDKSVKDFPMSLTLVFDHRVLSGREVSIFLNLLKNNLLKCENISSDQSTV